jgi:predicted nucleic acid-binding protein
LSSLPLAAAAWIGCLSRPLPSHSPVSVAVLTDGGRRPRCASVLAKAVADDQDDGHTAHRELRAAGEVAAPDLVDVETVAVLRRRWLRRTLTNERFATAVTHLAELSFERVPTLRLVSRAFELRANVDAYDACYVAHAAFRL